MSGNAAQIFNKYMAKQKVLVGTVTAEELAADLWGNVYFTNLRWTNPAGETIIAAPKARLQVRPWDIVWGKATTDSIRELELEQADLHIGFDKNMRVDILRQQPPTEKPKKIIPLKAKPPQNLQLPQRLPNITLLLKDTTITAHYMKRLFVLNDVDAKLQITKHELLHIKMSAGRFGGTLDAYGLYHFDNRHYQIDVKAKDLMAAVAAKNALINCQVDLDIKFRYLGKNANNITYGSFKSGKGTVMFVPFNSIRGNFDDQNKELSFHDVVISTDLGDFESNAFKVVKGKVTISDIIWVESNGQRTRIK